jgi:hypothetical protein
VTNKSTANQSPGAAQHPSFPIVTAAPAIGSSGATSRIYKSGKIQPAKPRSAQHERAVFCRAFIRQLDMAVCKRAREEERLFHLGAVSPALQSLLLDFHRSAVVAIDSTIHHHQRGAPRTLSDARNLKLKADQFDRQVHAMIPTRQKQRRALLKCVEELIADVRHYARQIEITFGIVSTKGKGVRPTNRPTNLKAKTEFARLILVHQLVHGPTSLPRQKVILRQLVTSKLGVSARTLGKWMKQMRDGTFDRFVQP